MKRSDPPAPVDELRQRLRTLGYLDAGVDRFVLAPAQGARGAAAIALLASVRIGALAGLLLGPAVAFGVAMQLPTLVTGMRDSIMIAIYMAVLFGTAVALAAMSAGLVVAAIARRAGPAIARHGRMLSIIAGGVVAAASLAYLTLMWTAVRGAGASSHAGLWASAGLAVAVAISLLLGHAVTLTALAILVAGTGAPMRTRGVPGATWPAMLGAGALAFGAALFLFNAGMAAPRRSAEPARLTVVPSGVRVRVFAIDGFDPAVAGALIAAGRLPALAAASQGSSARLVLNDVDVLKHAPLDPARLWTTVATAQPARVHGVETLETRRVAGLRGVLQAGEGSATARVVRTGTDLLRLTRPAVASGTDRREKTFWEVAADAGLRTAVVNWWATWPASVENAVILTDRATLRLERGGTLDAEIAPPALYDRLQMQWPALRGRAAETAAEALVGNTSVDGPVAAVLQRSAEVDAIALTLAGDVADDSTDLAVTYLPGLDIAQHALLGPEARPAGTAPSSALEAYYVALDRLLGPVIQPQPREIVVVVTAPGRGASGGEGLLLMRGGEVRAGAAATARATDVAPTILYALGVPISDALAGFPLTDLFEPRFVARYAVRQVPSYGRPASRAAAGAGQPLDQEMIDRLRSLGYVR